MTEAETLDRLKTVLIDQFEIAPDLIRPDARLYEDLGIDSIDAVDLIIQIKEMTGQRMAPEQFKNVRTLGDVAGVIQAASA